MTVSIELSEEQVAALKAEADAHGMTVESWLQKMIAQPLQPASIAHLQKTNPKEWMRQFRTWVESHDRTTPLLSDEAVSRESIYPE
jgi:hypothetical protein